MSTRISPTSNSRPRMVSPKSPAHAPKNWAVPFQSAACRALPPLTLCFVFLAAVAVWAIAGSVLALSHLPHAPSIRDYVTETIFVLNMVALTGGYFVCGALSVKWPRFAVVIGCALFILPWLMPAHHPLYAAAGSAANLFYLMRILEMAQLHGQHDTAKPRQLVFSFLPPPGASTASSKPTEDLKPTEGNSSTTITTTTTTTTTTTRMRIQHLQIPKQQQSPPSSPISRASTSCSSDSNRDPPSPISSTNTSPACATADSPIILSPALTPDVKSPLRAGFNGHALETFDDWDGVWRGLFIVSFHDLRNCRRVLQPDAYRSPDGGIDTERLWQALMPRFLREMGGAMWQICLVGLSVGAALALDRVWEFISPHQAPVSLPVALIAWPLYLLRCVCLFMSVSHLLSVLDRAFAMLFLFLGLELPPVQQSPLDTYYLSEFWGGRWNTQTHDMLYRNFYRPLKSRGYPQLGMLMAFAFSAALHAYPTMVAGLSSQLCIGAAAFFILHALFMVVERVVSPPRVLATRIVTFACAILTMPLVLEPFAALTGLSSGWTPLLSRS